MVVTTEETNARLTAALVTREGELSRAIERLREMASDEDEEEIYEITRGLREAVELVRCLRRMTQHRTAQEIHQAFGAPGDFGYETPIGEALANIYGLKT